MKKFFRLLLVVVGCLTGCSLYLNGEEKGMTIPLSTEHRYSSINEEVAVEETLIIGSQSVEPISDSSIEDSYSSAQDSFSNSSLEESSSQMSDYSDQSYSDIEPDIIEETTLQPSTVECCEMLDLGFCNAASAFEKNYPACYQDGCIFDNYMFLFNSSGHCLIYDLTTFAMVCSLQLPDYKGYNPHSNSVCFGEKYCESDEFPLLYTNVYNNYPKNEETYGVCFVYRITKDTDFNFELVQVIKIAFSSDSFLWFNNSKNESPYGNFLIADHHLIVYLNIFGSSLTRFFIFNLPQVPTGGISADCFYLYPEDIIEYFDAPLFLFIQGGTTTGEYIFSLEGFGTTYHPSYLRVIDLNKKTMGSLNLESIIGHTEPEFIDFYNGYLLIGVLQGKMYFISFSS